MVRIKTLALLALTGAIVLLSGCSSKTEQQESSIPWSRPAGWEGGIPGMGGMGGPGGLR
jgi:hypothetical protein